MSLPEGEPGRFLWALFPFFLQDSDFSLQPGSASGPAGIPVVKPQDALAVLLLPSCVVPVPGGPGEESLVSVALGLGGSVCVLVLSLAS